MKKMKQNKGFTLTELIIVIVIIGILAAVLIPSLTSYVKKAKISNQVSNATNMSKELAAYVVANEIEDSLSTPMVIALVESWGYSLDAGIEGYSYWYDANKNRIYFSKTSEILLHGESAISAAESSNLVREVETLNKNFLNLRFIDQSDSIYRQLIDAVYNLPSLGNNSAQGMDTYLSDMISELSNSDYDAIVKNFFEEYKTTQTAYISANGSFIYQGTLEENSSIDRIIVEKGTTKIDKIDELESKNISVEEPLIIPESVTDITTNALCGTTVKVIPSTVIEKEKVSSISINAEVIRSQASIISKIVDMDENDYTISYQEKIVRLVTGEEKKFNISDPIPNDLKNIVDSVYYVPKVTLINTSGKFNDVDMTKTNFSSHIDGDKVDYKLLLVDSNYVVYRLNNIAYLTDLNTSLYNSGEPYYSIESMGNKVVSLNLPNDFKYLANYKNTKLVIEYSVGYSNYEEKLINFTVPYYVLSNNVTYDKSNTYTYEVSYDDLCNKSQVEISINDKEVVVGSEAKVPNNIFIQCIKLVDIEDRVLVEKNQNKLCINYYDENGQFIETEFCSNGSSYFNISYSNDDVNEHYHRVWRSMDNENIYYEIGEYNSVYNELNLQYSWEIDKHYITYYSYKNTETAYPNSKIQPYVLSHLYPYGTRIGDTFPSENPTIRGNNFIGWNIDADAILTEDTAIVAQFDEPEYKVVLHLNYDGAEEAHEATFESEQKGTKSLPYEINELGIYTMNFDVGYDLDYIKINYTPVREGYVLSYWCYLPEGSTESKYQFKVGTKKQLNVYNGVTIDNLVDKTFNLYAIWVDDDGQSNTTTQGISITLDFGEYASPVVVSGLKSGYTLDYLEYVEYLPVVPGKAIKLWMKNDETTGTINLKSPKDGDVYYAVWDDSKTVTIDWNCEEIVESTILDGWYIGQSCYYKSTYYGNITTRLDGILPTREGYILLGINTTADATSTVSKVTVTDDITIYAIWIEQYDIVLDLNYEDSLEPTIIDTLYKNQSMTISTITNSQYYPSREGYVFLGWSSDQNSETGTSKVTASSDGIVYYAIWKEVITVYFNYTLKGLPECEECTTRYEGYSGTYTPGTVVGYTFMGWTTDLNNPVDLSKTIVFSNGKTYYAVWKYNVV
ncbi:MAG: InlB B-repeat-containing protein [Bacilli bacterium]